jgi:gas vesicle protein
MAGLLARSGRKSSAVLALALGVGAAAALLFAPKSGYKAR